MTPSCPGYTSSTSATGQLDLISLSFTTRTRSPHRKFHRLLNHFWCFCNDGKHSLLQCDQNIFTTAWTFLHHFLWFISELLNTPGGRFGEWAPVSEWLGLRTSKSLQSLLIAVSGCWFKILSISRKTVTSVSSVNTWWFVTDFSYHLTFFIMTPTFLPSIGLMVD